MRRLGEKSGVVVATTARQPFAIDETFSGHHFRRRRALGGVERGVGEQFRQREDTETIERRNGRRELSRMARAAHGQRLVEQSHFVTRENPKPQVVVLARRHILIEAANLVEQFAPQDCRRRADEAGAERVDEDIAGAFAMAPAGIDAPAVAQPGLAGLRDRAVGIVAHEEALARELFGHPQIVGIKEGDQTAARHRDTAVAGGSRARAARFSRRVHCRAAADRS